MLLKMIETDEVGLAVIDSLGIMLSKQAYEKDMTEKTYGGISMPLTLFSKKAELLCHKTGCTLIGINQMRDDMNSMYGGQTTTGGKAWKHNCILRIMFKHGDFIDDCGNRLNKSCESPAGNKVIVNIVKNKATKPDRRVGQYTLMYDYGVDEIADLVEVAMKYDIIQKGGAWFTFIDPETGEVVTDEEDKPLKIQGLANVIELLRENDILLDELKEQLADKF
jgi:recombination protein RecA